MEPQRLKHFRYVEKSLFLLKGKKYLRDWVLLSRMESVTGPWFDTVEALLPEKPGSATPYPLTVLTPSKPPSIVHTDALDKTSKGQKLPVGIWCPQYGRQGQVMPSR